MGVKFRNTKAEASWFGCVGERFFALPLSSPLSLFLSSLSSPFFEKVLGSGEAAPQGGRALP